MATLAPGWNFASDPTLTAGTLNLWAKATVSAIVRSEQATAFRLVRADDIAPGDTGEMAYSTAVDVLLLRSLLVPVGTLDDGSSTAPASMRTRDAHGDYSASIPEGAAIRPLVYDATNMVPDMSGYTFGSAFPLFVRAPRDDVFHLAGCVKIARTNFGSNVVKGRYVRGSLSSNNKWQDTTVAGIHPATVGVALKSFGMGQSGGVWLWPGGM